MRRLNLLLPALLVLAGCGSTTDRTTTGEPPAASVENATAEDSAPELVAVSLPGIPKVHRVGSLYLGAQPSIDGFEQLSNSGIVRLINLRYDQETPGFSEADVLPASGFDYIHLPWNGPAELTDEVFDRARSLLADVDAPTMLYCKSSNRVGAVWLPFRVLDQGVPLEQALAEARKAGLRAPQYEQRAIEYVESHR